MPKNRLNKYLLVVILAFIVAVLSMLHVILGFSKTPQGMVYLWTGHYYLDYFYYLTPIAQGARGILLSFSQAATDDPTRFIHLWPYTFIGYITKFSNLSPIAIYWLSIFILSFLLAFLIFKTTEKLLEKESFGAKITAFLFSLFATPFFIPVFQGKVLNLNLYDFWYSNSTFFRRFEPIPHHLLSSVFILIAFLKTASLIRILNKLTYKQVVLNSLLVGFLSSAVLSFNSFNMLVPFSALSGTVFLFILLYFWKKDYRKVLCLFIFLVISAGMFGITGLGFKNYYANSIFASVFKEVELALHQNSGFKTVFLSHGPLLIFSLFGLAGFLKKLDPLKILLMIFFLLSYGLYFSSIDKILGTHNGRFLSPLNYILLGSLAVLAIKKIRFSFIIIVILLLYFLPVNLKVFGDILNDRNISSPISYLPKGIVDGFRFLDKYPEKGDVLLTPSQFLGTVMPIYTYRRTYVARQIITPNYIDKNIRTSSFYIGAMSNEQAYAFLKKNGLRFVVLTSIEGYDVKPLFKYPFLREIYKNKDIIIFKAI